MRTDNELTPAREYLEAKIGPLTFGRFVQVWREKNDLSQVAASAKLGITKGTLCDIEKGRQFVSVSLAKKIAAKLGASEAVAIECCLQDQLRKAHVSKWRVKLVA